MAARSDGDDAQAKAAHEDEPVEGLSETEEDTVDDLRPGSAKVVHEVIRLQGDEELGRPLASLLFSGFAAGVAISASVLAEAFLHARLPDAPWAELVSSLGYSVGFVIVILGNLQLFTENTVTAVLPLATHPTARNFGRLLRLWAAVFLANLAGTLFVAFLVWGQIIVGPEQHSAVLEVSRAVLKHDPLTTLMLGMPAGFLVASIAWILPNAKGSEFWVIVMITYVIALGGFSHVVAGSGEAWLLWLQGETGLSTALGGLILPSLAGNIIGGTGLFAVLAHGQVAGEIDPEGDA
ncbi:formate/nitrite transporter family protein [Sphingomonas sp. PL-96]|uniref:formate/nitrite transporter family protein n=1 Tax=Sphingomonas sp. PL-96 TaxID=2887201 RepID=UPI001E49683F|nr:formate/nitrite transporter family protein [Sphingomonas sp. PL-96]MCC2975454.1 formate/nitrite transporter family protein [Sphingomonas sp. PL-96]